MVFYVMKNKNNNASDIEGFRNPIQIGPSNAPTQSYMKPPQDPFQINQVYTPFYNWPQYQYIGKYPYYRYLFHPYNSRVYYT